jgi:hypothetical protein
VLTPALHPERVRTKGAGRTRTVQILSYIPALLDAVNSKWRVAGVHDAFGLENDHLAPSLDAVRCSTPRCDDHLADTSSTIVAKLDAEFCRANQEHLVDVK